MILFDLKKLEKKNRDDVLHKIAKFDSQWKNTLGAGRVLKFKKDQTLFYGGHFPCGVFILLSGKVVLVDEENHKTVQSPMPLYQSIGIDLLMMGKPYPLTAICKTETTALFLSKNVLEKDQ